MKNSPPRYTDSRDQISVQELTIQMGGWLLACEIDRHSARTIDSRRRILTQFLWFCRETQIETCGTLELRRFLAYLTNGHNAPGGRWAIPPCVSPLAHEQFTPTTDIFARSSGGWSPNGY